MAWCGRKLVSQRVPVQFKFHVLLSSTLLLSAWYVLQRVSDEEFSEPPYRADVSSHFMVAACCCSRMSKKQRTGKKQAMTDCIKISHVIVYNIVKLENDWLL